MLNEPNSRLRDDECPPVDVEDIIKSLDGNLCRCTGYRPIVEAFSTFCPTKEDKFESTTFDKSKLKDYCPEKDDPGKSNFKMLKCEFQDHLIIFLFSIASIDFI